MKLYIARHGETEENKEKRILGSTPGTLTIEGRTQASLLAQNVAPLSIDLTFASDLQRVRDTCEPFDPYAMITFTPLLRERSFGDWEGQLRKEVNWQGLWESPDEPGLSTEINAEPLADFTRRIARFAASLHNALGDTDKVVLLVSHIGVMNRFNYLSAPDSFEYIEYPNAEATEFDIETIVQNSRTLLASRQTKSKLP